MVRACRDEQTVLFKFYAYNNEASKENEVAALAHFAPTGLVPRVLDATSDRLLLMSETPGVPLQDFAASASDRALKSVWAQMGRALAAMKAVPYADSAFVQARLQNERRSYRDASWRVYESEPTFQTAYFRQTLELQEQEIAATDPSPLLLCDNDLNPGNILVQDEGRLSGFVDLESCRPGPEARQLGVVLFTAAAYPLGKADPKALWQAFVAAYEASSGFILSEAAQRALLAWSYFRCWTYIHAAGVYGTWPDQNPPDWFVLRDADTVQETLSQCKTLLSP